MTIVAQDIANVYSLAQELLTADASALDTFVTIANNLGSTLLANCGYSADYQKIIEQYIGAHYVALAHENGGLVRKRTGDSEERYRELSTETYGLATTLFGQQAISLDTCGALASLSTKGLQAQFRVI